LIKQLTFHKFPNIPILFIVLKQRKMSLTSLYYSQCSICTDRTMESVYATRHWSAHQQCAVGMQSICETDAAATGRMSLWTLTV